MNIAIILGSVRHNRNATKVGNWIRQKIEERKHKTILIDPKKLDLPMLDRMCKEMDNPEPKFEQLQQNIATADGYVAITPEYNHTVSGAMKNTLDYCLEEYFFKPSAIVSYSVGSFGGINAGQHLRQIFAELGAPSIPTSLQISKVHETFDPNGILLKPEYEKRTKRFLDELEWYVEAFKNQRLKGTPY